MARTSTGNSPSGTGTSTAPLPTRTSSNSVNAFAERVSRFDLLALADIKRFVNAASLPADDALTAEMDAFAEAVARPTTPSIIEHALAQGFQQRSDLELNLGADLGKLVRKPGTVTPAGAVGAEGAEKEEEHEHCSHGIHALQSGKIDPVVMASDLQQSTDQLDRLRHDRRAPRIVRRSRK